ncbi:Uncharacterised protein [Vibrio cholerae]|nr:Uncharacterised protein [Vibrio cholerae]CSI32019.1 Uncharacterised protein [Vibrio cholerae]
MLGSTFIFNGLRCEPSVSAIVISLGALLVQPVASHASITN